MASCMAVETLLSLKLLKQGLRISTSDLTVSTRSSKSSKKHVWEENRLESQLRKVDYIILKNNFQKTTSASCTHYIQVFPMPSTRMPLGARPERLKEHRFS